MDVDAEQAAADLREQAGLRDDETAGAVEVAERVLGLGRVIVVGPTECWGAGELDEDGYILVRGGLDDLTKEFTIFHELGEHWVRSTQPPLADFHEKEDACNAIAAALLAPATPFRHAFNKHGAHLERLAATFRATQTAMALRVGEVAGHPVRVERPGLVRARGRAIDWTTKRGARIAITDAPDRVAYVVTG